MKILLLPVLSSICILPFTDELASVEKPMATVRSCSVNKDNDESAGINFQQDPGYGKMSSIKFKSQDYCRAELENFDFDVKFYVVSATVYFSGVAFRGVEKGAITSSSLKPVKELMNRCQPGSIVVFDDVKVKGPDNEIRTIPGKSLILY